MSPLDLHGYYILYSQYLNPMETVFCIHSETLVAIFYVACLREEKEGILDDAIKFFVGRSYK